MLVSVQKHLRAVGREHPTSNHDVERIYSTILPDTIASIVRQLPRGSVKRISGLIYEETRGVLKVFLENVIKDLVTYTEHAGRKTVTAMDAQESGHLHIAITALLAVSTTALDLSPTARASLTLELDAWNQVFGPSYLPRGASKAALAVLQATKPHARFELGRFALFSLAEFRAQFRTTPKPQHDNVPRLVKRGVGVATAPWTAWVFSATAVVEAAHCIATGTLLDVSEQDIVSCDRDLFDDGCNGGVEFTAMDWISKQGIYLANDYPYTSGVDGQNGVCQMSCKKQSLAINSFDFAIGEPALEAALAVQPVAVEVEAANFAWMLYKDGIVTECPGNDVDHVAVTVGYGVEKGVNYFKVRNSWGADWGEAGPTFRALKTTPAPTTKPAC
ncbi:hypothetical protein SDRG_11461 [Saprolegnia diclina VS20]|uniref:Peptidase C1A papain C-terminal domain-containing protein n=1 Tax=Saprolegnia diclina (strain VS20) TaxID=1156394 RepID=T0RFC5_SAPDV|nr:hypothetical protein SDRG_11461 [Saprolegnia diclina VS20]EQC30988.1 hypothetical protein SDRG_11461 [Saprolegnia diclina VS20]|eukprot:XP_008615726.1 hypothetical protein SDRG_11461 [Saprolegnia diclina VS20]